MRKKQGNKSLKIILILSLVVILLAGAAVGIFFALKNRSMRYYLVEISTMANGITLSNESKSLSPNSNVLSRPVLVNVTSKSSSSYLRAKVVYSSNSDDNRVLSFVNQLNFDVANVQTFSNENYSWQYNALDNAFYLMNKSGNLKIVNNKDNNYYFVENIKIPLSLKQISSLNSDGDNVQVGEDVEISIVFEAVQSTDLIGNKTPSIENVREHFNNFAVFSENDFTSENGFITNYTGNATNLILPKYVGEDYIIGIKENAFNSKLLQKVIIPGSYIYFNANCFSACTNLNYVAIKSETPIKLSDTAFLPNANLEIYTPSDSLNYIKTNLSTLPFINNFKNYTVVSSNKTSEIDTDATTIYAPNATEFEGDFKNFTNLKLLVAPSLTKINAEMFKNNTALIECDTPNVISIENSAFSGCTNLINASFSKKLESIGENSFFSCSKLLNVNFLKNVSTISKEAFRNCSSITNVYLNKEDVTIGSAAFRNCSSLKFININKLTKIDSYALSQCPNLKFINILDINQMDINENSVETSNNALFVFKNENIKSSFEGANQSLANKTVLLKTEDNKLVKYQGNIKNLNLNDFISVVKIEEISNEAFKDNTALNALNLPSSVKKLGSNIISGCTNLNSVTINSNLVPNFEETTFNDAKENLTILVPQKSLDIYKKSLENYNFTFLSIS